PEIRALHWRRLSGKIWADGEFCAAGGREHGRCALRLRHPRLVLRDEAMRTVIASFLIVVLLAGVGASAAIYAGMYDVAATSPHWHVTSWLLEMARARSIKAQAAGMIVPPGLGDPAKVILGVEHYAAHCAVCHGAPGVPQGEIAHGLYPQPADLAKAA